MIKYLFIITHLLNLHISYGHDSFLKTYDSISYTVPVNDSLIFPPMISEKNEWYLRSFDMGSFMTYRLSYSADSTLINGKYYKALLWSDTEFGNYKSTGSYYRQEGNKVYRKEKDGEILLYDFGLNIGDTLSIPGEELFPRTYIVTGIDSIKTFDGLSKLRQIKLKCVNEDGVNSLEFYNLVSMGAYYFDDLEFMQLICALDGSSYHTACFYIDGQLIYRSSDTYQGMTLDCFTTATNEEAIYDIKIAPNPSFDNITIQGLEHVKQIKIYNAVGEIELIANQTEIDISQLSAGHKIAYITTKDNIIIFLQFVKI